MKTETQISMNNSEIIVKHKEIPASETFSSHLSATGKPDLPEARACSVFQRIHTSFHVIFTAIFCRKV